MQGSVNHLGGSDRGEAMEAEAAGGCPQPRCSCENGDLIRAPFKHTGATSFEMGQYYLLVSLDRHQKMGVFASFLVGGRINFPNPFFSGCKLAEQYYNLGRKPFLALSLLAYPSVEQLPSPWGSWASDRIVIIGDYSDDKPAFLNGEEQEHISSKLNLYNWASEHFREATESPDEWTQPLKELQQIIPDNTEYVFMNLDSRQYLDPAVFKSGRYLADFVMEEGGIMQALYSTLFWSTGGGGGDIDELRQGRWAGQRLQLNRLSTAREDGYEDISQEVKRLMDNLGDDS